MPRFAHIMIYRMIYTALPHGPFRTVQGSALDIEPGPPESSPSSQEEGSRAPLRWKPSLRVTEKGSNDTVQRPRCLGWIDGRGHPRITYPHQIGRPANTMVNQNVGQVGPSQVLLSLPGRFVPTGHSGFAPARSTLQILLVFVTLGCFQRRFHEPDFRKLRVDNRGQCRNW